MCVCVRVCACVLVCLSVFGYMPCVYMYPQKQKEDIESPGAQVTDYCKLPDMAAGNHAEWSRVVWKSLCY